MRKSELSNVVVVDLAREEALAQRAEGDEGDPELLEDWQDLLLGRSPPKRVFALDGGDGLNRVGAGWSARPPRSA